MRPSTFQNQAAVRLQWSPIILFTASLGKYAYANMVTITHNVRQRSVIDFCVGTLDNLTAMEHRWTTISRSAAFNGTNESDDMASVSYSCTPTVHQGSQRHTTINCIMMLLNGILRGQSLQSALVFNFTNMNAISHWSDYFPSSCRVNF